MSDDMWEETPKTVKRVLITGIGGAIGVHIMAHFMHNTDWDIVGVDSFRHKGYKDRITTFCRNHPDWEPRLTIIQHDLVSNISEKQKSDIGHINYVINLASISDVDLAITNPAYTIKTNSDLMLTMLEYAREVKPEVFIQFSTDEVYGAAPEGYSHEEWSTILPSNPYSASKAAQEAYAISYWRTYGVPLIITNTMNNFGETQAPSKFPAMIQRKLLKGETVTIHGTPEKVGSRFYMHSRNTADALLFILKNTKPYLHQDGHIDMPDRYNLVGEKELTNLELAQLIAKLMDKELKYDFVDFHAARPGHDRRYGLDGSKMDELGWKPPVPFEQSLKNTLEWTMRHEEWS